MRKLISGVAAVCLACAGFAVVPMPSVAATPKDGMQVSCSLGEAGQAWLLGCHSADGAISNDPPLRIPATNAKGYSYLSQFKGKSVIECQWSLGGFAPKNGIPFGNCK